MKQKDAEKGNQDLGEKSSPTVVKETKIHSCDSFFFGFIYFICAHHKKAYSTLPAYIYLCTTCVVPVEVGRGSWISCNKSHEQLWTTMEVLRNSLGSLQEQQVLLTSEPLLQPQQMFFVIKHLT